jgi:hypothetical protein
MTFMNRMTNRHNPTNKMSGVWGGTKKSAMNAATIETRFKRMIFDNGLKLIGLAAFVPPSICKHSNHM